MRVRPAGAILEVKGGEVMSGRTIRMLGVLAFVLGVCLVSLPVALADTPQDYPSVTQAEPAAPDWFERQVTTQAETSAPDWFERQAAAQAEVAVRPDDLPGPRGPGTAPTETVVLVTDEGGFDWADAATGGAIVLGVVLLAGIVAWTATRHGPTAGRHAPT
jgi:hypothetical protein